MTLLHLALGLLAVVALALTTAWVVRRRALARLAVGASWQLVYADEGEKRSPLLVAHTEHAHIVGRPDRVYRIPRTDAAVIVEDKSRRRPPFLYDSHRMQLGAYVLLVEEHFHLTVSRALVRYVDGTVEVPVDDTLRDAVRTTLEEMAHANLEHAFRNHDQPGRCRPCQFRKGCPQAL